MPIFQFSAPMGRSRALSSVTRICVTAGISTLCSAWRGNGMHNCIRRPRFCTALPICSIHWRPNHTVFHISLSPKNSFHSQSCS